MAFDQGSPAFGAADAKVQTWASAGTYSGSIADVMSVQAVAATVQFSTAQLTGDDQITATAARAVGGTARLRFGGLTAAALAIITGRAATTISSVIQQGIKGGDRMPYFGLISKALAEEGGGDLWAFCPKCKLMGDFQIVMMEYGAFMIPEVTVQLVSDASYGIINTISHPTEVAITVMPPVNIAVLS